MGQYYQVPGIYQDNSNQSQGYFAFRFTCQHCYWQIDTNPIRSNVATASSIMDIGIDMIGGIWGRAARAGEQLYGSQWHKEQAEALQKSWESIRHNFHVCPKCQQTVCIRCFNTTINLCTRCAPDLKADGAQVQHHLNLDAQRGQIEQSYEAPQFNVSAIPSAATPDMLKQAGQQQPLLSQSGGAQVQPADLVGMSTPGYPKTVACPNCSHMGMPGKFCQDCGTKLPLPDLFCPNCSLPVESSARFCAECGTKLHATN
jgi:ribosomal protein L37AE/L43A